MHWRAEPLGWRRLRGRATVAAAVLPTLGAVGAVAGAVVAGQLAENPTRALVVILAAFLIGSAVLDTVGATLFSAVVGRAEGRLRSDLLHAALHQPLPALDEQAVGEVIDRVDDDPAQASNFLRRSGWDAAGAVLRSVLAWIVAGFTWPGAWFALPLVAFAALRLGPAARPGRGPAQGGRGGRLVRPHRTARGGGGRAGTTSGRRWGSRTSSGSTPGARRSSWTGCGPGRTPEPW